MQANSCVPSLQSCILQRKWPKCPRFYYGLWLSSSHTHQSFMENSLYPAATSEIAKKREQLTPETLTAWRAFSRQVFTDGALSAKTKDLIAVAVAHVTQCPYCIRAHTKSALARGATEKEIMEAIWVAAEMRAGGAVAHSALALDVMKEHSSSE